MKYFKIKIDGKIYPVMAKDRIEAENKAGELKKILEETDTTGVKLIGE